MGPGHNYNSNEQDVRSVIKDIYHSISLSSYVITGNSCAVPKGYIEFNLQVPGVSHFNQDHVTLLVKDKLFAKKIPLILRTRTLDCVVENLLASEEVELSNTWKRAKMVHSLGRRFQELGCHALTDEGELELKNHKCLSNKGIPDLLSHEEILCTAKMEYLPPHSNTIIKG